MPGALRRRRCAPARRDGAGLRRARRLGRAHHHPGARWRREWPVQHRQPGGTILRGVADLVLETPTGLVVIDHKSFPGNRAQALERAASYAPQLSAYAEALAAAGDAPVVGTFVHLPVSGLMVEVGPAA